MKQLEIEGQPYTVEDAIEKLTVADSFVVPDNKIGTGNGEAKLYVGNDNEIVRKFFGAEGFTIRCFFLKKDLLQYLEKTQPEYLSPEQPYNRADKLPGLWLTRKAKIENLPPIIQFSVKEQSNLAGPRVYINATEAGDDNYKLMRELSLPNISYIAVVKLLNAQNQHVYYFKLFADYFGETEHPSIIQKVEAEIEQKPVANEEKLQLTRARVGQGKYRERLLLDCGRCPITLVGDERVLIASHIKPWVKSNDFEKIDPKNGFILTPTFDLLFDRGFLSFTDDKKTVLSPFLSKMTYAQLGISDNKNIPHLPISGREEYLAYHRDNIFQK